MYRQQSARQDSISKHIRGGSLPGVPAAYISRGLLIVMLLSLCLAACAGSAEESVSGTDAAPAEYTEESAAETAADETESQSAAASSEAAQEFETAPQLEVGYEGMEPVYADKLAAGTYEISVDSSSSMFRIAECELEVTEDDMSAHMVLGGSAYAYLYPGTGDEAATSPEESWIADEAEEGGKNTFTFPVEALDMPLECAAYSSSKEHWYDRKLVFRADSLPDEAFSGSLYITAADLGLEDGSYECSAVLSGGSGKAYIESPCTITVADGEITARVVMSSSNYDYMIVNGEKYLPVSTEGNSVFEIPVEGFGRAVTVLADTTAMSVPYEIEYRLLFDPPVTQEQ